MRIYAGIGARETPREVLASIESIAARLARRGWLLRTGLSPGADQAFHRGARAGRGRVELYLPWPGFESRALPGAERGGCRQGGGDAEGLERGKDLEGGEGAEGGERGEGGTSVEDRASARCEEARVLSRPSPDAYELAARFHPDWEGVAGSARDLLARDAHEVLGSDLSTPAQLVICWTPDGDLDGSGPRSGGTGQALRIAHRWRIPVLNLARAQDAERAQGIPNMRL